MTLARFKNSSFLFMPLVLAAMTLRALIPSDLAPTSQGLSFVSAMCSNQLGKTELIEIPGELPGDESGASHCQYCVAPLLGAPPAMPRHSLPAPVAQLTVEQPEIFARPDSLLRAQTARAPPFPS